MIFPLERGLEELARVGISLEELSALVSHLNFFVLFVLFVAKTSSWLGGAGGVAWRGFDEALNNLCDLRQRLRLSQKCISAATPRFIFDFSRAISCQDNDSCLRVLGPDQPDDIETVMIVGHGEAQILNDHFVGGGPKELFSLFKFRSCIDFITLQRKILTHRETDRLFIVDDQQARHWRFSQRFVVPAEPHLF